MPLKAGEYQKLWRLLRVESNKKDVGTALKQSMGGDESPKNLKGEVTAAKGALEDFVQSWEDALESAANAILDLSTTQAEKQGPWLALLDKYLSPASFSKEIGDRIGKLSPSDFVTQKRKTAINAIVHIFQMYDSLEGSAEAGEAAVFAAYKDMYDARQKAVFKSFWASTDTEAHIGAVWAAGVSLRVGVEKEKAHQIRLAEQRERQRKAMEEQLEKEAKARELERKRLVGVLKWSEDELSYDRSQKQVINQKCEQLANKYPVDVQGAYNEELVQNAVDKAKKRLISEYGYQLSSNKQNAINAFFDLVATAAKKRYPVEDAAFVNELVEMAINLHFIGVSGSDDAEKSLYVVLRR